MTPKLEGSASVASSVASSDASSGGAEGRRPWTVVVMLALSLAVFLPGLDIPLTIVATATPTIIEDLDAARIFSWIGTAYMLGSCATTTLWAGLSATFGSKRLVLTANVLFAAGSLLCATATTPPQLICGRAIQGVGAGGLMVLVNVIICHLYPPKERGRYYGWTGMAFTIALGSGPFIAGLLTDKVSWRLCFYMNLPLDVLLFGSLLWFLESDQPQVVTSADWKRIDWFGSILTAGGVVMLALGLQRANGTDSWGSPSVWALLLGAALCLTLFIVNEQKFATRPLVAFDTLSNVTTSACLVISFCHGLVLVSGLYYLAVYFNAMVSVSPLQVGVYLLPTTITIAIVTLAAGFVFSTAERRVLAINLGAVSITLGYGLFINMSRTSNWAFKILPQIIAGIGAALLFNIPMTVMQASVPPTRITMATGTYAWARMLAMSLSLVLSDTVRAAAQKRLTVCEATDQSLSGVSSECIMNGQMYVWIFVTIVASFCIWAGFAVFGKTYLVKRRQNQDRGEEEEKIGAVDSEP